MEDRLKKRKEERDTDNRDFDEMEGPAVPSAIQALKGSESVAIFLKLQSMTPSQAAQSLDLTRKQEYDMVRKKKATREQREAVWSQVWAGFRSLPRHPFSAKQSDAATVGALCMGAYKWDMEWSHLSAAMVAREHALEAATAEEGTPFNPEWYMPHYYLSLCFYYASYVSNVYRYVRAFGSESAAATASSVERYHMEVSNVLELLRERKGRPILEVAILASQSKVKHHLFHQLFGYPKTTQDATSRLYLPAQLLFHTWTAINMDGRAFRLYHVMYELEWIANVGHPGTLRAVRLAYLDNTISLGKLLTAPKLEELSIWNCKEYKRKVALFEKDVTGSPSNVVKLILAEIPSLVRIASTGTRFPRLKELHLENVSFTGFQMQGFLHTVFDESNAPLKKLVCRGPRLVMPPDLQGWVKLPGSLSTLVLDNLQGVTTLPLARSSIKDVTLANIAVSLVSYAAFLSVASPAKLTLDAIKLLVPPPDAYQEAAPAVRNVTKEELKLIVTTGGASSQLTDCTFSNLVEVTDFQEVLRGAGKTLERLHILGSHGRISLPIKELTVLKDLVIDKAKGDTLSERLTPTSLAYWTRQTRRMAMVGEARSPPKKAAKMGEGEGASATAVRKLDFSPGKGKEEMEEDNEPPLPVFDPEEDYENPDEEEPVADIFASLEYMLIPFGAGRDKTTGKLIVPPWLPSTLESMRDTDPQKRLFASTWLEWETAVSRWLADETNDEGLLLYPAIGDLRVNKTVEMDDGEPKVIVFTTAGLPQGGGGGGGAKTDAEKKLYSERNKFLAGLTSQEFPVVLRYLRKERVIGRNEQTGTVVTSNGINLLFPLEALNEETMDYVTAGIVFDSDEFVEEADGLSKSCRVGFNDTRAKVKLDLGKLTLLYKREDDPFPIGFTFRITVAAALRFLAVQSAVLLTFQDVGLRNKMHLEGAAGAAEDEVGEAEEDLLLKLARELKCEGGETTFRPGEYARQLSVLTALSTSRGVATENPFFLDETDEDVLEAVREDPYRHLMAGSLLLVYAQTIGIRHVLALNDPGTLPGQAKRPLMRNQVLYAHLKNIVMPSFLVPVARWCIAWSPSEGSDQGPVDAISGEAQLPSVEITSAAFIAMVKEMGERLNTPLADDVDRLADAYAYVLEQLIPAPDLPDDDEVVAFSTTREAFAQLVAEMIDNAVTFSLEVRTRMAAALKVVDDALDNLTATFLEAKTSHSGDGQYLDTVQMAAYIKKVYHGDSITETVDAIVKAILEIVALVKSTVQQEVALEEDAAAAAVVVSTPKSPSPQGKAQQPQRKRFKQDLRADTRSSTSPEKPKATMVGLLPSPVSPGKPKSPLKGAAVKVMPQEKRPPAAVAAVEVIDLITPPSSPLRSGGEEVIDLTTPPRAMSESSESTPSSQLSSGEREERRQRRDDRLADEEQERMEEEASLEREREAREQGSIGEDIGLSSSICANCGDGSSEDKSMCTACRSVVYCDSECQREHWAEHKAECALIKAQAVTQYPRPLSDIKKWKVVYTRSGGFAGRTIKATILSEIDPEKKTLIWAIRTPRVAPPGCCDQFTHAIDAYEISDSGTEYQFIYNKIVSGPPPLLAASHSPPPLE